MEIVPQPETVVISPEKGKATNKETRSRLLLLLFTTFTTVVVVTIALLAAYLQQVANTESSDGTTNDTTPTIVNATWTVSEVAPDITTNTLTLTVNSSIGNIRHYSTVRGYGISNDRKLLAISNQAGIQIIDLATDTPTRINPPFGYSGELGQEITWAPEDKYFALAAAKENIASDTHILIYTKAGDLLKDISASIAYHTSSDLAVYPVKFSPTSSLLLARTYHADSVSGSVTRSPAYLSVYDITGNLRNEFSVRGTAADEDQIAYAWDATGKFILYAVTTLGQTINYADESLFTKVAI